MDVASRVERTVSFGVKSPELTKNPVFPGANHFYGRAEFSRMSQGSSKPQAAPEYNRQKVLKPEFSGAKKTGPRSYSITLYPPLPYHFLLYFKDRQAVHIELEFNKISKGQNSSILIKRKISSGNLEADLLSMRYLEHYLLLQQSQLPSNEWQSVKIELLPQK
jgi:hypothetical protein